jgi:LysR family transcriptional regulator, hydrogen peroxide-inducible genes activator
MALTLKQMRYCLAVAELKHFGRAAERCSISQSALSQQILLLEQDCGTAIFDRLGKTVCLTPFGAEFIERARAIIGSADDLETFMASQSGTPSRPIRFGLIPTVAPYLLPVIFPALVSDLPDLHFVISESRTGALLAGLVDGSLDLALIATDPPTDGPQLHAEPLFSDAFVLASHVDARQATPADLSTIARDRIMLLDEGHCFRDQAIAACGLDQDPAARTFAATSLSTIVEFVANGQGVTLLPEIALRKEATDPRIRITSLIAPGAGRDLRLVWRTATPFGAIFLSIAEVIRGRHKAGSPAYSE